MPSDLAREIVTGQCRRRSLVNVSCHLSLVTDHLALIIETRRHLGTPKIGSEAKRLKATRDHIKEKNHRNPQQGPEIVESRDNVPKVETVHIGDIGAIDINDSRRNHYRLWCLAQY